MKRWHDRRLLHMAVEITEAVLVMDHRAFRTPNIRLEEANINWRRQITYLGIVLDHRLNFEPHINKIADKAMRTGILAPVL